MTYLRRSHQTASQRTQKNISLHRPGSSIKTHPLATLIPIHDSTTRRVIEWLSHATYAESP